MIKLLILFLIINNIGSCLAVEPRPTTIDDRIKVMTYNPDDILQLTCHYGILTTIDLGKDEEIISVSMGDTTGWQVAPETGRIHMKPVAEDATTNMTLITNKRTYFFELHAEEPQSIRDPNIIINLRFNYPDEEDESIRSYTATTNSTLDLAHPEKYNFNYYFSGDKEIAPVKVFDDGEFTYLEFRDQNVAIPAIFAVDDELRESMVNYHLSQEKKNLVVIEQVFKKLTLRLSKKITCVYNESFSPY